MFFDVRIKSSVKAVWYSGRKIFLLVQILIVCSATPLASQHASSCVLAGVSGTFLSPAFTLTFSPFFPASVGAGIVLIMRLRQAARSGPQSMRCCRRRCHRCPHSTHCRLCHDPQNAAERYTRLYDFQQRNELVADMCRIAPTLSCCRCVESSIRGQFLRPQSAD